MEKIPDVTPGDILDEEFLEPFGISAHWLAGDIRIPTGRVNGILKGRTRITADSALRLSRYFGNSAEFWMGLQVGYDLRQERERLRTELGRIPRARTV